jgi:transcriptional regulator with XRE-family HTH domain
MRNSVTKLGRVIRERRELLGLIQPQLTTLSGISTRTIQLVEQGKGNPSLNTLIRLADPLGLSLELILKVPSENSDE